MIVHPLPSTFQTESRFQDPEGSIIRLFADLCNFPDRCTFRNAKLDEDFLAELDQSLIDSILKPLTFQCAAVYQAIAELCVFSRDYFLTSFDSHFIVSSEGERDVDDVVGSRERLCEDPSEEDAEVYRLVFR